MSNVQIAAARTVSIKTIDAQVEKLFRSVGIPPSTKTGSFMLRMRLLAYAMAFDRSLIPPESEIGQALRLYQREQLDTAMTAQIIDLKKRLSSIIDIAQGVFDE